MTETQLETSDLKFHSQRAIAIATFFGGPMAAGYLIRANYKSLGDPDNGKKALIFSILATFLLFVGIFSLPEDILDKIPNQLLPPVYMGIIYLIVQKIHGTILQQHEDNNYAFHSIWKAVGVGIISLLILALGFLAYYFLSPENKMYEKYDYEISIFTKNEIETLKFYDVLYSESREKLVQRLDNSVLPKWKENIRIMEGVNAYPDLDEELKKQNILLSEYAQLRLETFRTFKKTLREDTDKYDNKLEKLHTQIDEILTDLN
jgi:hypothetical protein